MVRYLLKDKILNSMNIAALTVMVLLCSSIGYVAYAGGTFANDPCDVDYYESLEARAWLEAQREITQNQNLIFKADSVLEYTCFDGYLAELADHASDMFSETTRWGGGANTDMAAALTNLVGAAINPYQTSNFNHNLLGGRSNLSHTLPASVSAGSYACNIMSQVWLLAKCMDFIDQGSYTPGGAAAQYDGFFTFAEYAVDPDKRFLPTACTGPNQYQANIDTALVQASTPWDEDLVQTYYSLIYPTGGAGGGAGACGPSGSGNSSRLQTGLIVDRPSGTPSRFNEYICVVPGCHYNPTAMDRGNCVP